MNIFFKVRDLKSERGSKALNIYFSGKFFRKKKNSAFFFLLSSAQKEVTVLQARPFCLWGGEVRNRETPC